MPKDLDVFCTEACQRVSYTDPALKGVNGKAQHWRSKQMQIQILALLSCQLCEF